jgi:hypothetical protein
VKNHFIIVFKLLATRVGSETLFTFRENVRVLEIQFSCVCSRGFRWTVGHVFLLSYKNFIPQKNVPKDVKFCRMRRRTIFFLFHFCRVSTKVVSISIPTSEFRFLYHILLSMLWFQSIFRLKKSMFLFRLFIGLSIPIVEIEIPITVDNFDQQFVGSRN